MNKPEWYIIVIGCIASIISGAVQPAFSIILSKAVAVSPIFNYLNTNYPLKKINNQLKVFSSCSYEERKDQMTLYCILFAAIGFITFISNILQSGMFGLSGECLTKRLRSRAFKTIISQDIGW